jgi:hypothetical protein
MMYRSVSAALGLSLFLSAIAGCGSAGGGDSPNAGPPGDPTTDGGGETGTDAAGDGGPRPEGGTLQMNDVSILVPLAASDVQRDTSMLKASTPGVGGPLLAQALYDSATGEDSGKPPAPGSPTPMPYADLRVVAIRLDPCFAHIGPITDEKSCENQLRLVFQPLDGAVGGGGAFTSVDGGVHVFFSLTRAEVVDMAASIASLRVASGRSDDLGPLAPHPIMVAEGLDGAFARGLFALVAAHAGPGNLVRFTRFQSNGPAWFFSGFDIAKGAHTPMVIPTLPSNTTSESFSNFSSTLEGLFSPTTTASDNMQLLANTTNAAAATPEARKAAFDAALRIENPGFHTPNTIDCASCHMTALARTVVGKAHGLDAAGNPNLFQTTSPFVSAADMKATTSANPPSTTSNLHVFSYKDINPSIAPRVINETAVVVDYLNSLRR